MAQLLRWPDGDRANLYPRVQPLSKYHWFPWIDFLGGVANAVPVQVDNMQIGQHFGHRVQVIPLTRLGRLGPLGDTRRHELVRWVHRILATAKVTVCKLLYRIPVEHVGSRDLDRVCHVAPDGVAVACLIDRGMQRNHLGYS